MRKLLIVGLFLLGAVGVRAGENNRNIGTSPVTQVYRPVTDAYHIRASTVIAANVTTLLVGTMTATNFNLAWNINHSTGGAAFNYTSSTTVTFGGRTRTNIYFANGASPLAIDYASTDLSTTTSRAITSGSSYSPDEPFAYQGPIYVRSNSTASVTVDLWFERAR
jgi:hypothetical protein